jgi:O-antigen ligase
VQVPFSTHHGASSIREGRGGIAAFLIVLVVVASTRPGAEGGAAPVDLILIVAAAHASFGVMAKPRLAELDHVVVGALVGAWVYLVVAAGYSLMPDAYPFKLLIDAFSLGYFFVLLLLCHQVDLVSRRVVWHGIVIASAVLLVTVLLDPAVRPAGSMANPNLTGTWFGAMLLALVATGYPARSLPRLSALLIPTTGLFLTQSYSAWLSVIAGIVYLTVRLRALWVRVLAITVVAIIASTWSKLISYLPITDRTDRSSTGRYNIWSGAIDVWQQHPWGVGYGGFARLPLARGRETHNDYLALLVETGIVGLIAWVIFLGLLYRVAGPAGRTMVIFVAINAGFHNVINYRHLWIALAVVFAWEAWRRARDQHDRVMLNFAPSSPIPPQDISYRTRT